MPRYSGRETELKLRALLARLDFDAGTGSFSWRPDANAGPHSGKVAGRVTTHGYRQLSFGRSNTVHAHVLVFLLVHGRLPYGDVDHINRNRLDNRPENLREATRSENCINSTAKITNKLGARGVVFDERKKLYRAVVVKDGRRYSCGRHKLLADAIAARNAMATKLYGPFVPGSRELTR